MTGYGHDLRFGAMLEPRGDWVREALALANDGWAPSSPFLPPESLAEANRVIDEAGAGRSPRDVVRAYNIEGTFTTAGGGFLTGPPRMRAEQLAELTLAHGISVYILYRAGSADFIRRFAAEVAPAVRQFVAAERARP